MSKVEKEAIAKAPSGRPVRQPVGSRNRLTVAGKDPGYAYRWVVDYDGTGDRLTEFKDAGYEFVPSGLHGVGDKRVDVGDALGSVESKLMGNGQKGYLMRQTKEFYDEDQKAKQIKVNKSEEALKTPFDGSYGKVEIKTE